MAVTHNLIYRLVGSKAYNLRLSQNRTMHPDRFEVIGTLSMGLFTILHKYFYSHLSSDSMILDRRVNPTAIEFVLMVLSAPQKFVLLSMKSRRHTDFGHRIPPAPRSNGSIGGPFT
ncbi:hypothetical protein M413DRAFT_80382 [Hebeloma cylindrosporum]|uniref:Uncharacterized protein n=1 Tax=Hebeloma cylindrosporum TaxID=76867 RepID=A0A0C2YFK3_HEBCY|nr:hypothetical protein M413DRAFT_80382 [Hebeloma cylindrosporum h7]